MRNLKFENICTWPLAKKLTFIALLCLLIATVIFYIDINPLINEKNNHVEENLQLSAKIESQTAKKNNNKPPINNDKNELSNISIKQLRAVGYLQQEQKIWGIFLDSGNVIHHVHIGSMIGNENIEITAINDKEIIAGNTSFPIQ